MEQENNQWKKEFDYWPYFIRDPSPRVRFSIGLTIILLAAFMVGYMSWANVTFNWPFDDTTKQGLSRGNKLLPVVRVSTIKDKASPEDVALAKQLLFKNQLDTTNLVINQVTRFPESVYVAVTPMME